MKRLRVAYVIGGLGRGGAEKQLYLLLKHLDREQFEPTVVSLSTGGAWAEAIRALGTAVIELPRRRSFELGRFAQLYRIIRRLRPDIVQSFLFADNVYGLLAGRLARVPVLIASRRIDQYGDSRSLLRRLNRMLTGWANAVICNAERSRRHAPPHLADRHVVIPNGVELAAARRSRAEVRTGLGLPEDAPVVGNAGRLVAGKNHRRFVEVAAEVLRARPDAFFILAGAGPLEAELREHIRAQGVEGRVLLIGERDDVPELLGALDVFLLTSDREGMSNTTMEASAAGLPCVVTDAGGNRELVEDGETGYVCASGSTQELAARVLDLLNDAELRRRLGDNGRRRMATRFAPAVMAATTGALYHSLAAAPHRRPGAAARGGVAYVLATFPTLTETFVVGEILELRRRGIPISLYALRKSTLTLQQPEAQALVSETYFARRPWSPRLLGANARWAARHPVRYARTLASLSAATWRNPVHLLKTLFLFPQAVEFADRMAAKGVPHVHAHWATYPTTLALAISKLTGLPFSFTAHAWDVSLIRTLLPEKLRAARFVVTCTEENQRELASLLPEPQRAKVHLNYHGITLERFAPAARPPAGDERRAPVIVACGTLFERKGLADLVRACGILRTRGRDFRCVIIGDGPQRARLEQLVRDERLDGHVELTGGLPQSEVIGRYAEADIFALPCLARSVRLRDEEADVLKAIEAWLEPNGNVIKDGIPNVLVEAMAMGIPAVSTSIAGIPELIEPERNGLLVPPRDPERLADALDRLLGDPAWRRRLGEAAAADVRVRFDRRQNTEALVQIFLGALGESPVSPIPDLENAESAGKLGATPAWSGGARA